MTNKEQMKLKPRYWLAICKEKVDDYEIGSVYKAEETFYNDPPSDWKCHLPIEQRGLEEFYDCYKIYLPHSSRGFTKAVINHFFELKEYKNFCGIVKYNPNIQAQMHNIGYKSIKNLIYSNPKFLYFENTFIRELNYLKNDQNCIDCDDDQELFLQLAKDNLSIINL